MKAIIFDLDNTLIDFFSLKDKCVKKAVKAMIKKGLQMDEEEAVQKIYKLYDEHGLEYGKVFQHFLEDHGSLSPKLVAAGVVAYREEENIEPYDGVEKTLKELKNRGYRLAILTDAPALKAWSRLLRLKLDDYFDVVVTFDDTGQHKPCSHPFKKVLEELGLDGKECMMVGDLVERDVEGGKKLGMKTCFAKYGSLKEVDGAEADYVLEEFKDLLKIAT